MAQDQRSEERSGYETSGYRETFAAACMVYARFLMLYTIYVFFFTLLIIIIIIYTQCNWIYNNDIT